MMTSSEQQHLYLIGYRGSGKSTVGRILAQRLHRPFVDTDDLVEHTSGRTIRDLFAEFGEVGFRDREQEAVEQVAAVTNAQVVSLGGGAILRDANRSAIAASGRCIWLTASAQTLHSRICADQTTDARRPSLSTMGGYDEVASILAAREPLYRGLADLTVVVEGKSPDDVVAEILDWVNSTAG